METTTDPGAAGNPPADAAGPDLQQLADQLAAKHAAGASGPSKRPRGRPRKDGLPAGSAPNSVCRARSPIVAESAPAPEMEMPGEPRYVVDPALVRRLAEAGLKGIEAWEQSMFYRRTIALGGDKNLAREVAG